MSHEGQMRRGKEEKERKLDTTDTRYYDQQIADGKAKPEDVINPAEQKKKEKISLKERITGIFQSKKSPEEKEAEIQKATEEANSKVV